MPEGSPYPPGLGGATITSIIGSIDPSDYDAKFIEDGSQNVYLDYRIESKYEKDYHAYMMPTAKWQPLEPKVKKKEGATISASYAQDPTVSFVQMAAPTLLWIVDWSCSRINEKPKIPNSTLAYNYGWILLAEHYEPAMMRIAADGVAPVWRISGTYVYGHVNPSLVCTDDIIFTRPPWLEDFVERNFPRELVVNGLIDLFSDNNYGLRT